MSDQVKLARQDVVKWEAYVAQDRAALHDVELHRTAILARLADAERVLAGLRAALKAYDDLVGGVD